jgi:hypothetical protein
MFPVRSVHGADDARSSALATRVMELDARRVGAPEQDTTIATFTESVHVYMPSKT